MSKNRAKNEKIPLTNDGQWCKMKLHSVILCLSGASAPNMVILAQYGTVVKWKSDNLHKK